MVQPVQAHVLRGIERFLDQFVAGQLLAFVEIFIDLLQLLVVQRQRDHAQHALVEQLAFLRFQVRLGPVLREIARCIDETNRPDLSGLLKQGDFLGLHMTFVDQALLVFVGEFDHQRRQAQHIGIVEDAFRVELVGQGLPARVDGGACRLGVGRVSKGAREHTFREDRQPIVVLDAARPGHQGGHVPVQPLQ